MVTFKLYEYLDSICATCGVIPPCKNNFHFKLLAGRLAVYQSCTHLWESLLTIVDQNVTHFCKIVSHGNGMSSGIHGSRLYVVLFGIFSDELQVSIRKNWVRTWVRTHRADLI